MDNFTEWQSIRPWRPTLALSVREITSVSVTFILSSPFTTPSGSLDPVRVSPASSVDSDSDSDSDEEEVEGEDKTQVIADVLAKGLSVKVNGIPWQRVLIRVDDEADEAVIILFGLMPGRQYDVELGVLPGKRSMRGQITTETEVNTDSSHIDVHTDGSAAISPGTTPHNFSSPPSNSRAHTPTHAPSPSPSPSAPPPVPVPLTLEDRRQQLTHALSALTAEHAQLSGALKAARREAQKADAGVRAEIEALRRAAERGAAQEQRAKQKVLALKEARRQSEAAARAMEEARVEVEGALPGLQATVREKEAELELVRGRAEEKRREREKKESQERKRREGWETEVAGLGRALERLTAKREKMGGGTEGGGTIGQLEERLRRLGEERERVERDPWGYEEDVGESGRGFGGDTDDLVESDGRALLRQDRHSPHAHGAHGQHHFAHKHNDTHTTDPHAHPQVHAHQQPHPHQHHAYSRKRHSHPHTHSHAQVHHPSIKSGPIGRSDSTQPIQPIQRPAHGARLSLPNHRELSAGPGIIHLHKPGVSGQHRPTLSNSNSGSGSGSGSVSESSSPVPPTLAPAPSSVSGSSLSGAAPPFEPVGLVARASGGESGMSSKSELNPGSNPFSPRSVAAQAVVAQVARARGRST